MSKNIVMVGAGVANVNAATKLIDRMLKIKLLLLIWVKIHMIENTLK